MIFLHTITFLGILCGVSAQCQSYRNVALQGRATQSSILTLVEHGYQSPAINAVDGNQDSYFYHGSCSHTNNELSPWRPNYLAHLWSLGGNPHKHKKNMYENMYKNMYAPCRCGVATSIPAGSTQNFYCHGMVGRYVNIILRGKREYLQLCEVHVWTTDKHWKDHLKSNR
ncbi:fucolectin-like [Lithobates pipiens]